MIFIYFVFVYIFVYIQGKIIVASPELDREDKYHYKLSVSAHSSDMISEKIFGEISIKITDENDNYPVFSQVKKLFFIVMHCIVKT